MISTNRKVLLFIFTVVLIESIFIDCIDINTTSGRVRGTTIKVDNKDVDQYLGIPYAEPPVGNLRFQRPKPLAKPLSAIIDGTKLKNKCIQGTEGNEDCLVLNIWTPKENQTTLKPVMFWIYGGGLRGGSINGDGGRMINNGVVNVAANYRLGSLGFFYGGVDEAPGNQGFYDQQLAIKWVRENIHLFGGDKDMITLYGESAGSWSVSAQVLSPLSKGLFRRAILQSGSILFNKKTPLLPKSQALTEAQDIAKHFNCSVTGIQMLDCLRKVNANTLIQYANKYQPFASIGTEFLPLIPQDTLNTTNYSRDLNIIGGNVLDEGSILSPGEFHDNKTTITEQHFTDSVANANNLFHELDVNAVTEFYLKGMDRKDSEALKKAFWDFYGDIFMKCPTYHFVKQYGAHNPQSNVYYYQWSRKPEGFKDCTEKMGVCHSSEGAFVEGGESHSKSKIDADLSIEAMTEWTNFVKTGNPGPKWPIFINGNQIKVRDFNVNDLNTVLDNPYQKSCEEFWKNYF